MLPKLKCHWYWNVVKTDMSPNTNKSHKVKMSPELECDQNWNVSKNEMSTKLKWHKNWKFTKIEMSQNWNITSHINLNVIKTEISPKHL